MWIASSYFVFFKQKTAYEMRISDWSSDVCSSDLPEGKHRVGNLLESRDISALHIIDIAARLFAIGPAPRVDARHDVLEHLLQLALAPRSEERRVGKECVSTCRSRWSQDH